MLPGSYNGADVNSCLCKRNETNGLSDRGYYWYPANSGKRPAGSGFESADNKAFCEDDDKSAKFNSVQTKCPLLAKPAVATPAPRRPASPVRV